MPSAAMTMAAAQASKKAFIVFHLAGLAECESNMMPGYLWYKDADRHDGSSLTGPYVFFAMKRIVFPTLAVMAAAIIVLRSHAVQIYGAPKPSAMMSIHEVHEKTDLKKLPAEEFEDPSLVFILASSGRRGGFAPGESSGRAGHQSRPCHRPQDREDPRRGARGITTVCRSPANIAAAAIVGFVDVPAHRPGRC